ncbi:MAG: Coenzyme F420 hydrogenase/dehydrogenase, beta subunit C-terminal domain [Candidatus Rokubacteria bacterium]|nr:Coenzyme F420 hydrogenase/dehydrogenase, beta subunit C-terminal domain [Candidatus Rokubacteria bacterium]MBI3105419.1 Coenzyme F420 hydrogenase/dehydrogenase, beta subunit C-terminal domain [Candidatus Rokubacteria bacterium]
MAQRTVEAQRGGPRDLQARVLETGLCTACGACLGHCPYLKTLGERVAFIHPCPLPEGRCFEVCPRAALDPDRLDAQLAGAGPADPLLGPHLALHFARALDPEVKRRGQYGGVTTALTLFALGAGAAEAALLTGGSPTAAPHPVVARDRATALAAAGTKYSACATLAPLAPLLREGSAPLAVVGRPCQVAALRKLEARGEGGHRLALVIGVFCFWALTPPFYRFLASRADLAPATKMDIPKEGGVVFSVNGGAVRIPLDQVRPFIRPACQSCFDPTAEWADLAVGSTEYDPDWNTLVVRTARGQALVDGAVAAGALEVTPYPAERIPILRAAVRGKKIRVLAALEAGRAEAAYLEISPERRAALQPEAEGGA